MPDTTPVYGFPFPELGDAPNGPDQIEDLALAVETKIIAMDTAEAQTIFTASGSFSKPANLKGVWVMVQAGGGGGGGAGTTGAAQGAAGAGGGGGQCAMAWIPASSLSASTTVTVGAGGAGASVVGGSGLAGGDSLFGTFVTANGGAGGAGLGALANGVSAGGAGGTGTGGSVTAVRLDGANGEPGRVGASEPQPSNGGDSFMGHGGGRGQGTNTSVGQAGKLYGGGGSGGFVRAATAGVLGSAGAAGIVVVRAVF
jgi:hypothetical protein